MGVPPNHLDHDLVFFHGDLRGIQTTYINSFESLPFSTRNPMKSPCHGRNMNPPVAMAVMAHGPGGNGPTEDQAADARAGACGGLRGSTHEARRSKKYRLAT